MNRTVTQNDRRKEEKKKQRGTNNINEVIIRMKNFLLLLLLKRWISCACMYARHMHMVYKKRSFLSFDCLFSRLRALSHSFSNNMTHRNGRARDKHREEEEKMKTGMEVKAKRNKTVTQNFILFVLELISFCVYVYLLALALLCRIGFAMGVCVCGAQHWKKAQQASKWIDYSNGNVTMTTTTTMKNSGIHRRRAYILPFSLIC